MQIQQDIAIFASVLRDGEAVTHDLAQGRHAWLQVVRGTLVVEGIELCEGDGASFSESGPIAIQSMGDSELLLFDMA